MSKYNKLKGEHGNDKYIVGGVVIVIMLIGLVTVWISAVGLSVKTTTTVATETPVLIATSTPDISEITPADLKNVTLAKCLAEKKITMYGAEWCEHCKDQKDAFGVAWQYVPYVECPDNVQLCLKQKVTGYPTWMKPDGTQSAGFMELDKLALWAECSF